jgi:hypothetical protein
MFRSIEITQVVERSLRERKIKFDKSLVGKRYDMGGGEIGTIKRYEAAGPYHWFVKFDKKAKLDSDWVNEEEIKKIFSKIKHKSFGDLFLLFTAHNTHHHLVPGNPPRNLLQMPPSMPRTSRQCASYRSQRRAFSTIYPSHPPLAS